MTNIEIKDNFIKLGQAMKMANLAASGAEAKIVVGEGLVKVNNETETRRGRKLYDGDVVCYDGNEIRIVAK
jgi:ribosome-associated protein